MKRPCAATNAAGDPCGAAAATDSPFCRMHDAAQSDVVAEGRRLGGQRRRREVTLVAAYDLGDIGEVDGIRRILDVAIQDALALENGVARLRVMIYGARTAIELLRISDLETRISALERDGGTSAAAREPLSGLLGSLREPVDDPGSAGR